MGMFACYMIKSALVLTMLYGVFSLLMSRETLHRANRIVLMLTLVGSFVVPALRTTTASPTAVNMGMSDMEDFFLLASVVSDEEASLWERIGWTDLVVGIYCVGLLAMVVITAVQAVSLARIIGGGKHSKDNRGNTLVVREGKNAPFSFMHYIVVSEDDAEQVSIITHEQEHVRLHHSIDIVVLRVVQTLMWFNPFVWMLGRDLQTIHEYEADCAVLRRGVDMENYQRLLIKKAVGNRLQSFANNLNQSSLKKRFTMMYCKKSSKWAVAKCLMMLPVSVIAVTAMARPELATAVESNVNKIAEGKVSKFIVKTQEKKPKTVIINTKDDKKKSDNTPTVINISEDDSPASDAKNMHIFVNGKEIDSEDCGKIDPSTIESIEVIKKSDLLKAKGINDGKGAMMIVLKKEDSKMKVMDGDDAYDVVEKMPEYPGGFQEMMKYLSTNVRYPEKAYKEKTEGRVIVRFVVGKDGKVGNVKVEKSISPELDAEAVRLVESMPDWTPGQQKGKNVNVKFVVPITFKLTK